MRIRKNIILAVLLIVGGFYNSASSQWRPDCVGVRVNEVRSDGTESECTMFETGKNVRVYIYWINPDIYKETRIIYVLKNVTAGTQEEYLINFDNEIIYDDQPVHKGKWQVVILDEKTRGERGASPVFTVRR